VTTTKQILNINTHLKFTTVYVLVTTSMFTILHMDKRGEKNLDTARHNRMGKTLNTDGKHFHPRHSLHPVQCCNW